MAKIELDTDRVILNSKYLPSELRQKPSLDVNEQAALVGVPVTTLEKVYRDEGGPRMFTVGRHRKALTADFMAWLERRAETHPYHRQESRNPNGRRGKAEAAEAA